MIVNLNTITIGIFMTCVMTASASSISCINGSCRGTANQVPAGNYPQEEVCGKKIGITDTCDVWCKKQYFKCGVCQSTMVSNIPIQAGVQEGCGHDNLRIFIMCKIPSL
ncbi:hypothetical protein PGTUg99_027756 [Puccinia graminis f. sp. tritici]|uniref:Uncharacterized protein n=1 Tax=Puccinia graminis f. sp. tritici TaxID=56615 RepID=A0A5B0SIQ3_PUCGR|nr:hypothetical protein PGTUg99_027756 [Puccinia graminis f. sp. tritici]